MLSFFFLSLSFSPLQRSLGVRISEMNVHHGVPYLSDSNHLQSLQDKEL